MQTNRRRPAMAEQKHQHAHLLKHAFKPDTREGLLYYRAWFSSLQLLIDAVGHTKWNNWLCNKPREFTVMAGHCIINAQLLTGWFDLIH